MEIGDVTSVIGILAAVCIVILAAYYVTRMVASGVRPGKPGSHCIRLLDRFSVSKDKMFVVVAAGQNAYLIGLTNQNITVIDTLDISEVQDTGRPPAGSAHLVDGSFGDLLNRVKGYTGAGRKNSEDR